MRQWCHSDCCSDLHMSLKNTHTSPVIKLGQKPNLQHTATYIFLMIQLQLTKKRKFRLSVPLSPLKSPWHTEKIQTAEHLSCLSIVYWQRVNWSKDQIAPAQNCPILASTHPAFMVKLSKGQCKPLLVLLSSQLTYPHGQLFPTHPEVAMCG